jgi:hypothetical protein
MNTVLRSFLTTAFVVLAMAPAAVAVEFEIPMLTPRLDSFEAAVPLAEGPPAAVRLRLAYDPKGKIVRGGECTVDGAAVEVKGAIKTKDGVPSYAISLRAPRGAAEKVSVKISGAVSTGSPRARLAYNGPRGKAAAEVEVALGAAAAVGAVSIEPLVDAKGKLSGSASIAGGFGNDPGVPASLGGSLKGDKLTLTLAAGSQKLSFKGLRQGAAFVGLLKIAVPPEKGARESFSIPDFTRDPGGGGGPIEISVEPPISPTADFAVVLNGRTSAGAQVRAVGGARAAQAPADASGRFRLVVELQPNRLNRLFVSASIAGGAPSAPVPVEVIQDGEPPALFIDEPKAGAQVFTETVVVAGRVGDLLSGFMDLDVLVNGLPANVVVGIGSNGTFERGGVPLEPGENTIFVSAVDIVGNETFREIQVERVELPAAEPRLTPVAGDGQRGAVKRRLAQPIVVRVENPDGSPFPQKLVAFEVTRSDGRLSGNPFASPEEGALRYQARTDERGEALAWWTMGSDAGCGNNRVAVTSRGIAGAAVFCASAHAGTAAQINVSSGNAQTVEAGSLTPEPLRVWVNDGANGVAGVPVTFRVARGGGAIGGANEATVATSITGHAHVFLDLGPAAGVHSVEADFPGNPGLPAAFLIRGLARDPERRTSFRGVVLNNARQPLEGAAVVLVFQGSPGAAAAVGSSDADGVFVLDGFAGSGAAELLIDGLEVTRAGGEGGAEVPRGSYPSLSYEVVVVPNAENSLAAPVLLPPLDPDNARDYDGTEDVVLAVKGVEGLQMIVRAGSMTRADGSRPSPQDPAVIALNPVHLDDVPMAMPDGAAPPFAWTLQPARARFDPPVEVIYPNMAALPAGAIAYFLSFNHDTARFEIVATGQVSADGAVIRSDPGSGITIAGWGGNCPPYAVTGDVAYCEEGAGAGGGAGDGGGAADEECIDCAVEIGGPTKMCKSTGTAVNSVTIHAQSVVPDGSFSWTQTSGESVAAIDGGAGGSSIKIVALGTGEAVFEAAYSVEGVTCTKSVTITVEDALGKFIFDGPGANDAALETIDISNFVTTLHLGDDDGHIDPDNFKVEVEDPAVANDVDEISVDLESLAPDGTSFSPERLRLVTLKRIEGTKRFRSRWLRLVVDGVDDGEQGGGAEAFNEQTLLVSTDPLRPDLDILGQIVRGSYKDCAFEARVGRDVLRVDLSVHVLTPMTPNPGRIVNLETAKRRVDNEFRMYYAQANISIGSVSYEFVELAFNALAISEDNGSEAQGGAIGFTITSERQGGAATWTVSHSTAPGATPLATAQALADAINQLAPSGAPGSGDFLVAEAFENQEISGIGKSSADVFIRDPLGGRVVVSNASSTDPGHPVSIPEDVGDGDLVIGRDSRGGTVTQRTLARNHGSTGNTIDVWVIRRILERDASGNLTFDGTSGRAFTVRAALPPAQQQREPLRHSAYVSAGSADDGSGNRGTIPHEVGHILLDASHVEADVDDGDGQPVVDATTQLMDDGSGGIATSVQGGRRFQDGLVLFDRVGGLENQPAAARVLNQVQRLRSSALLSP